MKKIKLEEVRNWNVYKKLTQVQDKMTKKSKSK